MTNKDNSIQYKATLLNPWIRLIRIVFIPVLSLIAYFFFRFLSGYQGRARRGTIPEIVELNMGWFSVIAFALLFALLIFLIMMLVAIKDDPQRERLTIHENTLKVESAEWIMDLKLNKAQHISLTQLPFGHKLFFDKYYRIARMVIRYQGDRHTFYFPISNQGTEEELLSMTAKKQK